MKFIAILLGITFGISASTAYTVYELIKPQSRDIIKLNQPFGTNPTKPQFYPIVHLANQYGQPFCTAFVVDANYAVTAGHCVDNGKGKLRTDKLKFLTENNTDTKVEVTAVGFDERTDFGLLLR